MYIFPVFDYLLCADEGEEGVLVEGSRDEIDCLTGAPDFRLVVINRPQPTRFPTNHITTAKYSKLSFLPCFLFEQFRRYSNCFFLFIALLQVIILNIIWCLIPR